MAPGPAPVPEGRLPVQAVHHHQGSGRSSVFFPEQTLTETPGNV